MGELVEQCNAHYQVDKNPLWAWLAANAAMAAGLAIPEWTREYLAAAAKALADLARQPTPPDPVVITRALGLEGKDRGRTPFTELSIIRRDIGLAQSGAHRTRLQSDLVRSA